MNTTTTITQTTAQAMVAEMTARKNRESRRRADAPVRFAVAKTANTVADGMNLVSNVIDYANTTMEIELLKLEVEKQQIIADMLAVDTKEVA